MPHLFRINSSPLTRLVCYHTQVLVTVIPTQKSVCMGTECQGFAQRYQAPLSKRSSLVTAVRAALYTCRLPALSLTRHLCSLKLPNLYYPLYIEQMIVNLEMVLRNSFFCLGIVKKKAAFRNIKKSNLQRLIY